MEAPRSQDVTTLLRAWSGRDQEALEKLTPLVYQELHSAERRYMIGERSSRTLQTTALINEIHARLIDARRMDWQNRAHSFAVCVHLMRRILTGLARSRRYQKREGGAPHTPLDEALVVVLGRQGTGGPG